MTTQPNPAEIEPDQAADDAQYYRRILHRLIDKADSFTDRLYQQAPTEAETLTDLAKEFDRIALCTRRCIMLARKCAEPLPMPRAQHRIAARQQIIRVIEDNIQRHAEDDEADELHEELLDRMDSPDLDDDITTRPIADIIADICRDLGLAHVPGNHPWKRRTPADLTLLRARAAAPPGNPGLGATEARATLLRSTSRFRGP